jgi:hypothetical protein
MNFGTKNSGTIFPTRVSGTIFPTRVSGIKDPPETDFMERIFETSNISSDFT